MKQETQTMKRLLCFALALMMVFSMMPRISLNASAAGADKVIFLKPNSNWTKDNARFAAYFFGNGEKWVDMSDTDDDGIYAVSIPSGYPNVIFCRMNPGTTANNWDNKWNQTGDLTVPNDDKILFTVPSGDWNGSTSGWSTYAFYVAGTNNGWDEKGTAMVGNIDGSFSVTVPNLSGEFKFKVTAGDWDNAWGDGHDSYGNTVVTLETTSDVTIKFVPFTEKITTEVTCLHVEDDCTTEEKASTCSEAGYKKVVCKCGYTVSTETLPLADHTYNFECSTDCSKCDQGAREASHDFSNNAESCTYGCGTKNPDRNTVYCINSSNWEEVYVYAWLEGGVDHPYEWPGAAMTKTGETVNGFDVYSATFDAKYGNVIFNNNDKGSQTSDLTVKAGRYYDVKTGTWYESLADVPAVDTSATDVYLVGGFNNWSTDSDEFKKAADGDTTATVTMELEAGTTYEFKIVNAGAWTSYSTAITGNASGLSFSSEVDKNATITTAAAGKYVFTYDLNANTLAVTYPQAAGEPTYYQVGFDTNCDAYIASQTVEADGLVIEPEDPIREGFTFVGWYSDEALTKDYDFDTPVTGDFTLYAKWTEDTVEPEDPDTITVYFRNDWLWPEVYVHYWNEDKTIESAWRGDKMTKVGTDGDKDVYSAELPAGVTGMLFNGDHNELGTLQQTPDIFNVVDGQGYFISWDDTEKANSYGTFTYTPAGGGDEGGEDEPAEKTTYTVIFHFANTIGWNPVNLYVWNDDGATTGGWPGTAMTARDENGYNTMTVTYEAATNKGLNYIFNNGSAQTGDLKLDATLFDAETNTAEVWIELKAPTGEGNYELKQIGNKPLEGVKLAVSPKISGTSVTFEYVNDSASTVEVRGTVPGATWDSGIRMTKNGKGIWTVTVEDLTPAVYQYKFVVDGTGWVADPSNGKTDGEGNSVFTIVDPNAVDNNKITINVYYDRADGIYVKKDADGEGVDGTWNAYVWGDAGAFRKDYEKNSDGKMMFTLEVDGRATKNVYLKNRLSTEDKDWLQEEGQVSIALDNIVSGTVNVYVTSNGTDGNKGDTGYSVVHGTDIFAANKVTDVQLDYQTGEVVVTMLEALDNANKLGVTNKDNNSDDISVVSAKASGKTYTLTLSKDLDLVNLYHYQITFDGYNYPIGIDNVYATKKFADEYTYTGKGLGATYTSTSTTFKVWAPTAESVSVKLYATGTKGTNDLIKTVEMIGGTKDAKGVWTVKVDGDLNGTYYTYAVTIDGETVEAVDPYARTTGVNGNRGMVIDLDSTDPEGWAQDENPNKVTSQTDAIIYELHVRDFSIDASSGMTNKGKYLAFTETGTTVNGEGEVSTGIDYLDDLGITHLHLLPVYDYGSVDETTSNTFNWGYDPQNYNVPEGSYSTDPYNGAVRVKEFKQMVKSLHDHDISVVMDVVYNHVYNADTFCFNNIVPGYFSRPDSNTSGCGNDTASEREMVRKYIVESVLYWHQEYHIDGFRFDLVGLLDVETINEIVETVHECCPDVIFYGEGWDMDGTNREPGTEMAKQGNASKTPGFAYFSDSFRDEVGAKKEWDHSVSLGFASGKQGAEGSVVSNFMANPWWTSNPQQVIQYVSCHDNYTMADKLVIATKKSEVDNEIVKMNNLAAAIYLTAQGVPFIHAHEEVLREKLDENGKRVENSYNASDHVNHLDWNDLVEYADTVAYYKGLIEFRKENDALRYASAKEVSAYVQSIQANSNLVVFRVDASGTASTEDEDILVIFNADKSAKTVNLPEGTWTIRINDKKAGTESLGTATDTVNVAGISAMVLTTPDEGKDGTGPSAAKTIYFTNSFTNNMKWEKVYAYSWTNNGDTKLLGDWPGTVATFYKTNDYDQDVYQITLPASETGVEGLIFSNGADEQTVDIIPGADGTGYYPTDSKNEENKTIWNVGSWTERAPALGDADEYFLVGYINGANYTGIDYKFIGDGIVTTTFSKDSYVYVVNGDSSEVYMTDGYKGAVSPAILKDTNKHTLTADKWDKLLIPGDGEVVITMVKNDDNTITLSYESSTSAFEDQSGIQNGVTLHAWNWSFDEIADNMATIAAQGYTAVQTSPIQPLKEATNGTDNTVSSHWWVYYQPVDFVITTDDGNALGTKADFAEMCVEAEKYGIKVIVDVVANHLANYKGNDLSDQIPEKIRNNKDYWHDITTNITNWNDRYNMTQYCLTGLPDLNTANDDIQKMVLDFLKECVDAGADGFRFDMAKSIETPKDDATFASDFWPNVVGGIQEHAGGDLYIYGEILDDAKIAISAYTEYMSVTDNEWGNHMRSLVASGTAALAEGFYKSAPASNLVIWAESHDTFATDDKNQSSAGVSVEDINKTWALVAARKDAMGLYLARPESMDQALGVASVTGWANKEVKAVNRFHNAFIGESETIGNSGKFAYVVRGATGIVIVNAGGTTAEVELTVPMADGTYTDQITGNAFTVADGKLTGKIGDTGIAVMYAHDHVESKTEYHKCDICGETISLCADDNDDHKCDICDETVSLCADGDENHKCDICGEIISLCVDTDNDHVCDTCKETISLCADGDENHKCDICDETVSVCVDGDKNHKCDICDEVISLCADATKDHKCDICGETISLCADDNDDHKCDICDENISVCADGDKNHKCDICGEVISVCADATKDHKCDICGEIISLCVDTDNDHVCDTCKETISLCADGDENHKCDICDETVSVCVDGDKNHKCDICDEVISLCADATKDHKCDICDEIISVCVDNDNNHTCDICNATIRLCIDATNDHKCDICGEVISLCADDNDDHKCDICGEVISLCADDNDDHKCDICGEVISLCADDNNDYKCDICGRPEPIEIPVSGNENSIQAVVTIEGSTAKVEELDSAEIDNLVCEDRTVSVKINLSGLPEDVTQVSLTAATISNVLEAAEEGAELTIQFPNGSVKLNGIALEAVVEQSASSDITLVLESVGDSRLNEIQKDALSGVEILGGFEAYMISGDCISDFKGGVATLSVPFAAPEGMDENAIKVWYVSEDGELEELDTWYEDGTLNWSVGHFSDFVVIYEVEEPDEPTEPDVPSEPVKPQIPNLGKWFKDLVEKWWDCVKPDVDKPERPTEPEGTEPEEPTAPEKPKPESPIRPNLGGWLKNWLEFWKDRHESCCDHNYVETVKAPTCTKQGYTQYRCEDCGDTYQDNFVKATGHSYKFGRCTMCGVWKVFQNNGLGSFECVPFYK